MSALGAYGIRDLDTLRALVDGLQGELDYLIERVRDIARGVITAEELLDELEERCP